MSDEFDLFKEYLKRRGLRLTTVRKAIVNYLENIEGNFSAADMRQAIRVEGTPLNPASLYRNLLLLKQAGLIAETSAKSMGRTMFRRTRSIGRRYELHCPGCHRNQRINDAALDAAIMAICAHYHLKTDGVTVRIDARHERHPETGTPI